MLKRIAAMFALLAALPCGVKALGPHELLILVNQNSPASIEVAHEYIRLRQVPRQNVLYLDLPARAREPGAAISPDEFTAWIWEPARQALRERLIEDHILAWVYAPDFPARIAGDPPVSLLGATFTRNQPPPAEQIKSGQYRSLLFCGPDKEDGPYVPSRSLDQYAALLRQNMPLPGMMLGHTGAHGLSVVRSLTTLKYGAISDGSAPDGAIYLVKGSDVRATTRAWQFEAARAEIASNRVNCLIVDAPPAGEKRLLGILMGKAVASPASYGSYLPGAVCDNLTSFGAAFEHSDQTKLTRWLEAGATAAAGTVTEPFAIWTKFPNARLFAHYTAGNTILESYFQSIRCPLQILLVGDPLARPWGKAPPITLINLSEDREVKGLAEFFVTGFGFPPGEPPDFLFLMDGRSLQAPARLNRIRFDSSKLADGYHELRCVAYLPGMIRHQSFSTAAFVVNNRGRTLKFTGLEQDQTVGLLDTAVVRGTGAEGATNVALLANGRKLATSTGGGDGLTFTGLSCGPGPASLQLEASFADGEVVRSAPVQITVLRPAQPRQPLPLEAQPLDQGTTRWSPVAGEGLADKLDYRWYLDLLADAQAGLWAAAESVDGVFKRKETELVMTTGAESDASRILLLYPGLDQVREISFEVLSPATTRAPKPGQAAVIYHYEDADHFRCFGLSGENSALAFFEKSGGVLRQVAAVGASLEAKAWQHLSLRQEAGGLSGYLEGERLLTLPGATFGGTHLGVQGGYGTTTFRRLAVSPSQASTESFQIKDNVLTGTLKDPARAGLFARQVIGWAQ